MITKKEDIIEVIDALIKSYMELKFKDDHSEVVHEKFLDLLMGLSVYIRMIDKSMPNLVKTVKKDEKLTLILNSLYSLNELSQKELNIEEIDISMLYIRTMWEDYTKKASDE